MSSHEQTCYTCWTTFYTTHPFVTTCPTCQQTKQITSAYERQAEQRRLEYEAQRREQEYLARQQMAIEQSRIDAINKQTQAIFESTIDPSVAYDQGKSYLTNDYPYNNSKNLNLTIHEDGLIWYSWNKTYITPHLQDRMDRGLCDSFPSTSGMIDTLKQSAYQAGRQNALGTLQSYFTLYTGMNINGIEIKTEAFNSKFTSSIDENTGELKMNWYHPFKSDTFNEEYAKGVNEVYQELNTDEWKEYRLLNEVPEIQRDRKLKKKYKLLAKVYGWSAILTLIFLSLVALKNMHGWLWLIYPAGIFLLYKLFDKMYTSWEEKNKKYLEDD